MAILGILEDSQDERLVVAACQALEKLALDADNEAAVTEMGGRALLYQLATTSTSGRVQETAWQTLQSCTCQKSGHVEEDAFDMQNWAQVLLPRLQDYPTQLTAAVATAANLCVADPMAAAQFGTAGGLVAMATALQRHWTDAAIRSELAGSMTRICEAVAATDKEKLSS